jgi:hypothetical protein
LSMVAGFVKAVFLSSIPGTSYRSFKPAMAPSHDWMPYS